jgi:multiple sugar transport system ATP-binding protein
MARIALDRVEKMYGGGVKALDDLNLEVKEGEFTVLVGPSGCGKSTALRSIAGLEEISSGTISIGERVVNGLPPKDRDIATVFQNYALCPHMTVADNLAFGLKLRHTGKAEIKRRVDEAAQLLGLEPYLSRKPAALSGGQRQRVAMGRAIVREPAAFLMDEPLSNLDAKLRVSMRAALNQLHERLGTTTVYVTHDQVEAMTLGSRVCVMRDGRLQQVDTPQALFDAPVNLYVAGFIGSPAMNFVTAELVRDDGPAVTFAGFRLPVPASVISGKPGLEDYFGRPVILGVRPSDFEDGAFGDAAWPRLDVTAGVTERLGTEIHAIFAIDAPPVEHASIASAAAADGADGADGADEEDETVAALVGGRSLWTARVSSRSLVRPGPRSSWPSTPAGCTSSTRRRGRPSGTRSTPACRPGPSAADSRSDRFV